MKLIIIFLFIDFIFLLNMIHEHSIRDKYGHIYNFYKYTNLIMIRSLEFILILGVYINFSSLYQY